MTHKKASNRPWVETTKASSGAVVDCLLFDPRTRSGGVLNSPAPRALSPTEPLAIGRFPVQRPPRKLWKIYRRLNLRDIEVVEPRRGAYERSRNEGRRPDSSRYQPTTLRARTPSTGGEYSGGGWELFRDQDRVRTIFPTVQTPGHRI